MDQCTLVTAGVDIGKDVLDVHLHPGKRVAGAVQFLKFQGMSWSI